MPSPQDCITVGTVKRYSVVQRDMHCEETVANTRTGYLGLGFSHFTAVSYFHPAPWSPLGCISLYLCLPLVGTFLSVPLPDCCNWVVSKNIPGCPCRTQQIRRGEAAPSSSSQAQAGAKLSSSPEPASQAQVCLQDDKKGQTV